MQHPTFDFRSWRVWLPDSFVSFLSRLMYQRRLNTRQLATVQVWVRR